MHHEESEKMLLLQYTSPDSCKTVDCIMLHTHHLIKALQREAIGSKWLAPVWVATDLGQNTEDVQQATER